MARHVLFILLATCSVISAQFENQTDFHNMAQGLMVKWRVVTNTQEDNRFQAEVIVENTATRLNLTYGPWEIHFSCRFRIEPDSLGTLSNSEVELKGQGLVVGHLQGDHFYLRPTQAFISLPPASARKVKLKLSGSSVARTDSMPNWYMTMLGLQPVVIASTQGEGLAYVEDRTSVEQWKRSEHDACNPFTAQDRYERNYVTDSSFSTEIRVIPTPTEITMNQPGNLSKLSINSSWSVTFNVTELSSEARYLTNQLGLQTAPHLTNDLEFSVIDLRLGQVTTGNGTDIDSPDAYHLLVQATRIEIVGRGQSGVYYGIATLLSLMDTDLTVPQCSIVDYPRFEYRGLMLDLARNFYKKEEVVKVIELMSSYKLNKLHLHLSDDEGWRIEIPALPELTELGSKRCHDLNETICLMPQLGSAPDNSAPSSSGFLTATEYIDLVKVAKEFHVTIIPEISMPSHGRAAILSMKLRAARLNAQGQGDLGDKTTLVDDDDHSEYSSPEMFSDNAINPCLESTYNFIDIIMNMFLDLHKQGDQPLTIFHFGGDEVGPGAWLNSSFCQSGQGSGLSGDSYKSLFFKNISQLAASKNLSLAAREDGFMLSGNSPFSLSASNEREVFAFTGNNVLTNRTVSRTYTLANQGYKVVLTDASHLYLDHPYEPDAEEMGVYWAARFTDTKKLFSYNAERFYDSFVTQPSCKQITTEELCGHNNESCPMLKNSENIIGMEGTLFTETIRTNDELYHSLFPRLLALAERAWHKASWESLPKGEEHNNQLRKDWSSFARALGYRELPKLSKRNVAYRIPPPGAVVSFGRLLTTTLYPGLVAQYSFDAGITWHDAEPSVPIEDYKYLVWLRTRTADSKRFSRTVVLEPTPPQMIVNQPVIDYIGKYMGIQFSVVDNFKKYGDNFYEAKLQLTNLGNVTIPSGNWRIYFCSVVAPEYTLKGQEYVDMVAKIIISHTKGYLFNMRPSLDFPGLEPGKKLEFFYKINMWSVSRFEQMPRWYVSAPGMKARNLVNTAGEDLSFVSPFTTPEQWKRFAYDRFDPWTPEYRFDRNSGLEVLPLAPVPVIPTPSIYSLNSSKTISLLEGLWTVVSDDMLTDTSQYFRDMMLQFFPGIKLNLSHTEPSLKIIRLKIASLEHTNNTEAYEILVHADPQIVEVFGSTHTAVFYGVVTLIQTAIKYHPAGTLPEYTVVDSPRFVYRGMHVDTARNFIPKQSILKLLDVMSLYKLNKLHFHLSDDEGWRLEIPSLEELTRIGGKRCHNLKEDECVMSTLGSGADKSSSGSGFYTVKDYQEILQHANKRHIEVIPEFDMPGHAHSAIAAMKVRQQKLKDIGDHSSADEYVLHDANDTSHYFSVQFYTDNALNPCIESTYRFIDKVYKEVKEIHKDVQPLKVFHFGGDEVAKGAWVNSSACAGLIRSGVNLKSLFTQKVSDITRDVTLGAWEDGLMDHDSVPWNRSLLANKDVIVNSWQNVWEWGVGSRAYNLANEGYKVVFSAVTHLYLDHPQEPNPEERGFYWGTRFTDALKTFSFMPDDYYMNADIKRSGEPITLDEICGENKVGCPDLVKPENIWGIQGQLWSETVRSPEQFEYMIFPRLLALAERSWHKAEWEGKADGRFKLKSDWARFAQSLGNKDLTILDKMNVTYRVPPPGARQYGATISANVEFPGLKVHYKLTDSDWKLLQQSSTFKEGQNVTLRTVSADGKRYSSQVKITITKISTSKDGVAMLRISLLLTILTVCYYLM